MDRQTQDFAELFRRFLEEVVQAQPDAGGLSPIGLRLQEFLGTDVASLPVVTHAIAAHRLVDADVALADLAAESGSEPLGVSGGQMRDQAALGELIAPPHRFPYSPGPIDYVSVPSGPDSTRRVMSFGLHLLHFDGSPLVVLQRAARPERGRNTASLEVLTADPAAADAFLAEFGRRMLALSVLRGQVLSFTGNEYGQSAAGATFLPRPTVAADDVVLAPGVLDAVVRHVVGVGEQRE